MERDSILKRLQTTLIINISLSLLLLYTLVRLQIPNSLNSVLITAVISFFLSSSFLVAIKNRLQEYPKASFYLYSGLMDLGFRALIVSSFLFYFNRELFSAYDTLLLGLFCIGVGLFLFYNRKKLVKDGPMYLYKTEIGLKFIEYMGSKYKKTLRALSYVSIAWGYLLMAGGIYLLIQLVSMFSNPEIVGMVKIPPIMPLIPYLSDAFNISWLPHFPFIDFILAIAIVAIFHEGFHGIFAKFYNIKIKSTGFGFLGPFLAFFVEQDDKQMQKAKPFAQLSVLSAGVFANVLLSILFLIIMGLFFSNAYAANGAIFNDYTYSIAPISAIAGFYNFNEKINVGGVEMSKIGVAGENYFISSSFFALNLTREEMKADNSTPVKLYWDEPAIKQNMKGAIVKINNVEINSNVDIANILKNMKTGDTISIDTRFNNGTQYAPNYLDYKYNLILGKDYTNKTRAIMGIASVQAKSLTGLKAIIYGLMTTFKDPNINYEPKANPELTMFVYTLLWWLFWINLSVALANMLPIAIFDGGRFFYLTILVLTGKKKIAEKSFKWSTGIILGLVALSMILYVLGILRLIFNF